MDKDLKEKVEALKLVCSRGLLEVANKTMDSSPSMEQAMQATKQAMLSLGLASGTEDKYDLIFLGLAVGFDANEKELSEKMSDVEELLKGGDGK